jgi:hypothetical protein
MLNKAMSYRRYPPSIPQEKIFCSLCQSEEELFPQKTKFPSYTYLKVWHVVDIRDATQIFHKKCYDSERQGLRFEKNDVRTWAEQYRGERGQRETAVIQEPRESGFARRRIHPSPAHVDAIDLFTTGEAPAISIEDLAGRIVRHCGDD